VIVVKGGGGGGGGGGGKGEFNFTFELCNKQLSEFVLTVLLAKRITSYS